ncbi:Signal transduction histidine kinase [Paenibacillus sp. UNCCL117]|uniref:sensor histidine kinase n=1 Tax=unclassified Paenibacillus TaxID=185978 RepID=UPI000890BD68|nr:MULTISPECIES: HAMP domain-containing sensor histidine kinase [unclassified Paenibacillus]SDE43635.1 Signal transduction histidine kinase [Paenibacillus sp. cl123]SFW46040.1 Signal transduction histidine kinase [Paenibacillus sp. UNCCL117]
MEGIIRILRRFVATTILVSFFLLIFNFILLGTLVFKEINQKPSPEDVVKEVAESVSLEENNYILEKHVVKLLQDNQAWAMLLDGDGYVQWDYHLPDDVPRSYRLVDVAKFSRYYLMDYPVYIWTHKDGLIVVGYPKTSYGKYQLNFLSDWVRSLPLRLLWLLLINVAVALLVSIVMGTRLMRGIRPLVSGVHSLAKDEAVRLNTRGIFGDLAQSINAGSTILQNKTAALKARDEARSNWIAGISHDIRTPLSMILGYSSEMEDNADLPHEHRYQAGIIRRQGEKLRSLVNDLNLVSMLEYDMQPLHLKSVRLSALARQVVADFLNNGLGTHYDIELVLTDEAVAINGDEKLLLRAINNLVQNSVRHNPQGCKIILETFLDKDRAQYRLIVRDNGRGIPPEQLMRITELPYSLERRRSIQQGHGLGLPMVARIANAHQGRLHLSSEPHKKGLEAVLEFPLQLKNKASE